jgi:hypothetical protein
LDWFLPTSILKPSLLQKASFFRIRQDYPAKKQRTQTTENRAALFFSYPKTFMVKIENLSELKSIMAEKAQTQSNIAY